MNIVDTIFQFDPATRLVLGALALTSTTLIASLLAALVSKRGPDLGFRRFEIVGVVFAFLFIGSMTLAGRTLERTTTPEELAPAVAEASGGGTGTCASVRPGMSSSQVRTLLGKPSIDQSAEDTRGPGARVMVFDNSRCVVHLINDVVDQIE